MLNYTNWNKNVNINESITDISNIEKDILFLRKLISGERNRPKKPDWYNLFQIWQLGVSDLNLIDSSFNTDIIYLFADWLKYPTPITRFDIESYGYIGWLNRNLKKEYIDTLSPYMSKIVCPVEGELSCMTGDLYRFGVYVYDRKEFDTDARICHVYTRKFDYHRIHMPLRAKCVKIKKTEKTDFAPAKVYLHFEDNSIQFYMVLFLDSLSDITLSLEKDVYLDKGIEIGSFSGNMITHMWHTNTELPFLGISGRFCTALENLY